MKSHWLKFEVSEDKTKATDAVEIRNWRLIWSEKNSRVLRWGISARIRGCMRIRVCCISYRYNLKMVVVQAKVTLASHTEYTLKFEMEPILDHVAIRDVRHATKRAYQRAKRRSLRMYALRSQTWKIKNLETPPARESGLRNLFDYSLFVRTC